MRAPTVLMLCLLAAGLTGPARAEPAHALFGRHHVPSASEPASLGSYASGCLAGGVRLPTVAAGWQAMKPARNRYWGHPRMIEFIDRLSRKAQSAGWPGLYIGDIGQPRGGPMKSGHRSHQIGLDVDIWLRRPTEWREMSAGERDGMWSHVVVADNGVDLNGHWTPSHHDVLRAAAEDDAVARIFVNAAIKRWMCERETGADGRVDAPWLRKIRPWKGHNAHFHVRLRCPLGSPRCRDQGAPPPGPGCGAELSKWFSGSKGRVADDKITAPAEEEGEGTKYKWGGKAGKGREEGIDFSSKTRGVSLGQSRSVRGALTLGDLPDLCRAVLSDDAAAMAQIDAYAATAGTPVASALPVFVEEMTEAHPGFVGTRYFWRPDVDLTAARERDVKLVVRGTLPPGLSFLDRGGGNGLLSGTPAEAGTFNFEIVASHQGVDDGTLGVSVPVIQLGGSTDSPVATTGTDNGTGTTVGPATTGDRPQISSSGKTGVVIRPIEDGTAADASLAHQVRDFLTEFTGDECFLAVPHRIARAEILIETFADDAAPIIAFDRSFLGAIGIEARVGGRLIAQPQCPALAFARTYSSPSPSPIETDDEDRVIAANEIVTLSIPVDSVRHPALILVGPDGAVVDLTDFLQRTGSDYTVSLQATGRGPQVLVAIDTEKPIPAEDRQAAEAASDIFSLIVDGTTRRELDPRASLSLIVIE